jgi:hypothetical protein
LLEKGTGPLFGFVRAIYFPGVLFHSTNSSWAETTSSSDWAAPSTASATPRGDRIARLESSLPGIA